MTKIWNNLKVFADNLMQPTMKKLQSIEKTFNDKEALINKAEYDYMQLELSEEDRKIIEDMLSLRMEVDCDYSDLAYIAGLIDCYTFLTDQGFLEV